MFGNSQKLIDDLDERFTYHAPHGSQTERYELLRAKAKELAVLMCLNAPASRELSLAITKLEESSMWCNAAIARRE